MNVSEATVSSIRSMQSLLSALTVLKLTDYHFPTPDNVCDGAVFDFVIVGSGPGGSTLANRLTADGKTSVLLIEAGGIPPLESTYAGLFPLLTYSKYDWNISSTDNSYSNQYLQNNNVEMTTGKMLGGSSSLHHVIEVTGNYYDYELWAAASGDDSYNIDNMRQYLKKRESLKDPEILAAYPSYHGTSGPIETRREPSDKNKNILASFKEQGHDIILDVNANITLGYTEPLLSIGETWRQSAAETYLNQAKNRSTLYLLLDTLVTKVLINNKNTATGVEVLTASGAYKTFRACKEVIVCAGALKTPQLLMLSGVGPREHLEEFDIEVKADLPVGDNLIDHVGVIAGYTLAQNKEKIIQNPTQFPTPLTTGFVSLDYTDIPTYQAINLYFTNDNAGLSQLCVYVFKYKYNVCQPLYEANKVRDLLFVVIYVMHPESRGTVRLASTDPTDNPIVNLGHLSNPQDLVTLAKSLQDFNSVVNTKYFKSVNSSLVDLDLSECKGLEKGSYEFFECYAKAMSATSWHYCGTCPIGTVLDRFMMVKGIKKLRVVDASAMPDIITGKITAAVYALAEKAADMIKTKWCLR